MKTNVGLSENDRKDVAEKLSMLLADTYMLYLKTQNYHWNVTGGKFSMWHTMFEEQYTDLAEAVDLIAERIRALGHVAPGSFAEFLKLATLKEASGNPSGEDMVKNLINDHESIVRHMREIFKVAQNDEDEVTLGILTDRMMTHEKTAWMLRSSL